jgi:HEAT repeat protein
VAWLFPAAIYQSIGLVKGEATFDGKPTDYWVHALKKEGFLGGSPPSGDAGKTLRLGGADAVPVLCEIAQGPDDDLRSQALMALNLMGAEAKGAKPVLDAMLRTETNISRFEILAKALGNVDPSAAGEALGAVLREKPDHQFIRQQCACTVLIELAPQGQEAVPALKEVVDDTSQNPFLRAMAIDVLWRMKQPADPLIQTLLGFVKDEKSKGGMQALMVLGDMGPSAKSALPTLLEVLDRPNLPLAGAEMSRLGPANRTMIYRAIGLIGPDASAAIPRLLGTIESPAFFDRRRQLDNYHLRTHIGLALAQMGAAGKQALTVRDAVWGASVTLLGAQAPGMVLVPSLAEIQKRTWLPHKGDSTTQIVKGIWLVDPLAARRVGLPTPVRTDEADFYKDD